MEWNAPGRYGWVGGTGTAAHVNPLHDTVSVILTQVGVSGPDLARTLETFWTAPAT
ncbi:MAG: hypothetical protein WCF36_03055 [Candidatus Nanopelagicales bacterium]